MAHIKHALVGDTNYGARLRLAKGLSPAAIQYLRQFNRQALHAFALGLNHPTTDKWMRFEVQLPEDMQQLIRVLREDKQCQMP
jgi:23S rRNA pseudouridine1911/1915/1917 synthase